MTTHSASYQIVHGNGAPVAISPNNTWYIDDVTNALYLCENGVWQQVSGGGGGVVGANPTATGSNVAVNGAAATFMRSDAAPAIQLSSATLFGLAKVDGVTITAVAGVISSVGGATGANPTATASGVAVNGVAATFMRSDAAPAVQKASAAQFGIVEVDNTTIEATAGVINVKAALPLTSVTFGAGTALNDYEEGTWTPTDASGAALSLTNNRSTYTRIGRFVNLQGDFAYPVTANGSNATVGGLPFNFPANVVSLNLIITLAAVFNFYASGTTLAIYNPALARQTNANVSSATFFFSNIGYPAT